MKEDDREDFLKNLCFCGKNRILYLCLTTWNLCKEGVRKVLRMFILREVVQGTSNLMFSIYARTIWLFVQQKIIIIIFVF